MPTAALASTAARATAALKAGALSGASVGYAIVFMQNDTSAHACGFVSATTQCRQIN